MATSREPFTSAANAYDRHVGRYGAQLAAGLVEVADIRQDQRVLDVGCGPGPLIRALADRTGESNVAAIDPSPEFRRGMSRPRPARRRTRRSRRGT